jgi:predicted TIM-barrel fold metal-dependent hydrolase
VTDPHRIDVHHHFLPPEYLEAGRREGTSFGGGALIPDWDLARARADQPARFGGFACLPLPETAAACAELEYALDTLDLDGVLLMSSSEGRYPGDPGFEELFAELARRRAVVFIHPTIAPPGSKVPQLDLPEFMAEFVFDTTRCVANLLYSGTLERYPEIRFIVAHAGDTVPFLAGRLALGQTLPKLRDAVPKGPLHYLKQLHFDTALSANPYALALFPRLAAE